MSPLEIDVNEMLDRVAYHLGIAKRRCVVRGQDACDLQQDIFLAVFTRVSDFDSCRASWSTFLNMIIEVEIKRFRLRKRWRKYQPFICFDELSELEHPLTNFYPSGELNDLERHIFWHEFNMDIDKLPDRLREICVLLKRHSKSQTASKLQIPNSNLYRQIERIRNLLKKSKVISDFLYEK
jgi:RNA polymerase sigma factor (sigma-70 family)